MVSSGWVTSAVGARGQYHIQYMRQYQYHIYIIYSVCSECMSCCADVCQVSNVAVCSCAMCSQLLLAGKLTGVLLSIESTADMAFFPFDLIDTDGPAYFDI